MPNRIIRSDLLDSDRYWNCGIEARELFTHMLLLADDLGCISITPAFLGRRAFDHRPAPAKLAKLIAEIADQDLIRVYNDGLYAFIPRFGQRLRIVTQKNPPPPFEVYSDDEHAVEQFSKINNKVQNVTDRRLTYVSSPSDEEKRSEVKRREDIAASRKRKRRVSLPADFCISDRVLKWAEQKGHTNLDKHFEHFIGYVKANGKQYADWDQALMNAIRDNWAKLKDDPHLISLGIKPRWWSNEEDTNDAAARLGITARNGEGWADFRGRIERAIAARSTSSGFTLSG